MPLIPGLLILGPVLFAGLLLIMLSQSSSATVRPHQENPGISSAFTWATDLIGNLWHRIVRTTISHFAASHLLPIAAWFGGLNTLALGLLRLAEDATATARYAVERLTGHTIPQAAKKAAQPALTKANAAHATATKANAKASSTSQALATYRTHTNARLNAHGATLHKVTTVVLPGINTELDRLSTDAKKLRERTTSLENGAIKTFEWIRTHPLSAVTKVAAGAIAVALASIGFGVLRCRNWQNMARKLTCGMGAWLGALLDLIATFALGLLGVLRPEVLAEAAVEAVDALEPILQAILSE